MEEKKRGTQRMQEELKEQKQEKVVQEEAMLVGSQVMEKAVRVGRYAGSGQAAVRRPTGVHGGLRQQEQEPRRAELEREERTREEQRMHEAPRAAEEADTRAARKPSEQPPSQPRWSWWIQPRVIQQYEEASKRPLKPDVEKRMQAKMLWAAQLDERPCLELTPREFGEREDRVCAMNYVLGKIREEGRDASHLEGYAAFVETVRRCQEANRSGCWLRPPGLSPDLWQDTTLCTKRASK